MKAAEWDERYRASEYVWTTDANRFLVSEVSDLPPGRALDLATGEGRNAVWLASLGWRVTAIDFSEVGLDKGRRLATDRGVEVDWILADVTELSPPGSFDLVTILYLQVPRNELRAVCELSVASLRPGGVLLMVGHDRRNLASGYGGPQDPAVLWDPDLIAGWLDNLDIERAETVQRPVEAPDGERIALDCLVRASRPAASLRASDVHEAGYGDAGSHGPDERS